MHAILVAAGSSRRMGFDKLLAPLAGQPVLWHSIRALAQCAEVESITLVTRPELFPLAARLAESAAPGLPFFLVAGGAERHLSVSAGLEKLAADGLVAVHDAARPLLTPRAFSGCLALARQHAAASCAVPVADTVKRANESRMVLGSVERVGLWAMQTPQMFELPLLRQAYAGIIARGELVTDEVSAMERLGRTVALFDNPDWNFKITYPRDIELAEMVLASRARESVGIS